MIRLVRSRRRSIPDGPSVTTVSAVTRPWSPSFVGGGTFFVSSFMFDMPLPPVGVARQDDGHVDGRHGGDREAQNSAEEIEKEIMERLNAVMTITTA